MQKTSLEAYFTKVLPILTQRHQEVLAIFQNNPRLNWTNMELADRLGWSINRVTPRVFELREANLLTLARRRKCRVTGSMAMAWKLNQKLNSP